MPSASYRIAVLPGDGIGREVMPVTLDLLEVVARRTGRFGLESEVFPWGCAWYRQNGAMMPADELDQLRPFDAILLGAVGAPDVPDHVSLWGMLIPIRRAVEQY